MSIDSFFEKSLQFYPVRTWLLSWAIGLSWPLLVVAQPPQVASTPQSKPARSAFANVSPQSPLTAYVAVSQAAIYSGPATATYPTGRMNRGQAVEVFHRTKTGWLGIRPPTGSFSWVKASDGYLLPGGRVLEVTRDDAVSWIGTQFGSAKKYRWQVQLHRGEQLTILGESESEDEKGQQVLWYKIFPPSGEFRWIEENNVALEPPAEPGIARVKRSTVGARTAAAQESSRGNRVRSAAYNPQLEVFGESVLEGASDSSIISGGSYVDDETIVHDGYVVDGYMDGDYAEGEYYIPDGYPAEGELIYLDDGYGEAVVDAQPVSRGMWDGWHLFDLSDDGFRIPFLERRLQNAQVRHDPMQHDPFSLAMVRAHPVEPPSLREQVRYDTGIAPQHRYTPWRDPRELREQWRRERMQGATSATDRSPLAQRSNDFNSEYSESLSNPDELGSRPTPRELLARLASALDGSGALDGADQADGESTSFNNGGSTTSSNTPLAANAGGWYGLGDPGVLPSQSPSRLSSTPAAVQLGQLQASLSEMVSRPMESWNFAPIASEVQRLVESAPSPVERGQARLMLEKLDEFQAIARRAGLSPTSPIVPASGLGASSTATGAVSTAGFTTSGTNSNAPYDVQNAGALGAASLYDATGRLIPVYAAGKDQPSHALTNDNGQIIAYVSGLPGMNLDLYVNQSVGIQGLRGYLPQLKANHIQAQRVVRLTETLNR